MGAGQPRKYKSAEELEAMCNEYITNCPDFRYVQVGFDLKKIPHPTVTGLALFLGYESRQSCYDNEKIPEYSYVIKKTRLAIEKNYENLLAGGNAAGAIFALKNMGWSDKQVVENQGGTDNTLRIKWEDDKNGRVDCQNPEKNVINEE